MSPDEPTFSASSVPGLPRAWSPDRSDFQPLRVGQIAALLSELPIEGDVGEIRPILQGIPPLTEWSSVELIDPDDATHILTVDLPTKEVSGLTRGQRFTNVGRPRVKPTPDDFRHPAAVTRPDEFLSVRRDIDVGLLERFRDFWFEEAGDPAPIQLDLPLLALHCPRVSGCSSEIRTKSTEDTKLSMSLSILGMGGGTSQDVKSSDISGFRTKGGCQLITVPAQLNATFGYVMLGTRRLLSTLLIDIVSLRTNSRKVEPLGQGTNGDHICGLPPSAIDSKRFETNYIDMSTVDATSAPSFQAFELEMGHSEWSKIGLTLTIMGIPVSGSLTSERRLSQATTIACELAPGRTYHWYRSLNNGVPSMDVFWTIA